MARKPVTADTQQVRRILKHYRSASPATLAAGSTWYAAAQDAAAAIWPERPDIAAGVIAALSPRCQWITNVRWAYAVVHAARYGQECPAVHTTTMRRIAWAIATGEQTPADALKGPKIARFYRNILGDMSCATVDVWAARAAEGANVKRDANGVEVAPSGRRYEAIENAYIRAAEIAGTSPSMMQAVTWIQVRGRAN
jgi:hypothetical protein